MITKEQAMKAKKEIISDSIKVSCTWGEGPDVLFTLDGKLLMCYEDPTDKDRAKHGFISKGSMDLTAEQALDLAAKLVEAASQAKMMDISIAAHCEREKDHEAALIDNADKGV